MSKFDVNFDWFWAPFWWLLGRLLGAKLAPNSDQKSIKNRPVPPDRPKTAQEHPKSAPRAPQESPREPKRHPKGTQKAPKSTQKPPKSIQKAPKSTQKAPKNRRERRWLCRLCRLQLAIASVLVSVWFALGCSGCFGCFGCLGLKIDRCSRPWVCFVELIRCCRPWVCFLELIRRFPFSAAQVSSHVPPKNHQNRSFSVQSRRA